MEKPAVQRGGGLIWGRNMVWGRDVRGQNAAANCALASVSSSSVWAS